MPQAHFGWDNFQDLKEPEVNCSDSDDEDEDFVLYKDSPNSHNLDSKRMVLADKVFSPFDMN